MQTNLFVVAQAGFVAVALCYFGLFVAYLFSAINQTPWTAERKSRTKFLLVSTLLVWTAFLSVWSASGTMSNFENFPMNFAPVLFTPLVLSLLFAFSKMGSEIIAHVSHQKMMTLQSFRIPVELLLWLLFTLNLIPEQMTFEGRNFDILVGITGPVVALLLTRQIVSRSFVKFWNLAGLALLINIVTIAFLSTPTPLRVFMNEPANTVVTVFPISFLPGLLVPFAYTLHFLSLRKLAVERSA